MFSCVCIYVLNNLGIDKAIEKSKELEEYSKEKEIVRKLRKIWYANTNKNKSRGWKSERNSIEKRSSLKRKGKIESILILIMIPVLKSMTKRNILTGIIDRNKKAKS